MHAGDLLKEKVNVLSTLLCMSQKGVEGTQITFGVVPPSCFLKVGDGTNWLNGVDCLDVIKRPPHLSSHTVIYAPSCNTAAHG